MESGRVPSPRARSCAVKRRWLSHPSSSTLHHDRLKQRTTRRLIREGFPTAVGSQDPRHCAWARMQVLDHPSRTELRLQGEWNLEHWCDCRECISSLDGKGPPPRTGELGATLCRSPDLGLGLASRPATLPELWDIRVLVY